MFFCHHHLRFIVIFLIIHVLKCAYINVSSEIMLLSKKEKLARLKIMRCDSVGPSTFWNLIKLYGDGEKALKAIPAFYKSRVFSGLGDSPSGNKHFEM